MNILGPTRHNRLNEAGGFVFLGGALLLGLAFISYFPEDPSFNTFSPHGEVNNVIGPVGARFADLFLQTFGLAAFFLPGLLLVLSWYWLRSAPIRAPWIRLTGAVLVFFSASGVLGLARGWRLFDDRVPSGGLVGMLIGEGLRDNLNLIGSLLICSLALIVSLYLLTSFELRHLANLTSRPRLLIANSRARWTAWIDEHRRRAAERKFRNNAACDVKRVV
jgi:S-DNA-T family DNA segregation ATPase FtsK/SpoIIIE